MDLRSFTVALWNLVCNTAGGDGRGLESAVRDLMVTHSLRSDHVPGGYSLLGFGSASGLWHQVDAEAHFVDAILVLELKAYTGALGKNELLRFVAATDDLWAGQPIRRSHPPVYRGVAGTFHVPERLRVYAALHGVVLIDPMTVPVPLLASPKLVLPADLVAPHPDERRAIDGLVHPLGSCRPNRHASAVQFGVRSQLSWSGRLLSKGSISEAAA
jgi:hypothetical protein